MGIGNLRASRLLRRGQRRQGLDPVSVCQRGVETTFVVRRPTGMVPVVPQPAEVSGLSLGQHVEPKPKAHDVEEVDPGTR